MPTSSISLEVLRSVVERHHFHVLGVRYGCALRWAAIEREGDPRTARVLLNIDLVATPASSAPPSSLHLLLQIGSLAELAPLLNEALCDYLAQQLAGAAADEGAGDRVVWRVPFPLNGERPN